MTYAEPPLIRPTSGWATASMVLGIIGLLAVCLIIPSLLAILFGHQALRETKSGIRGGHSQAVAGLITGYLGVVPGVIMVVTWTIGVIAQGVS